MERATILTHLIEVIENLKSTDGWTDLAVIGKPLAEKGLNYKALGFLKLKHLLLEFPQNVEIKTINSFQVPVLYARITSKSVVVEPAKITSANIPTTKLTASKPTPHYLYDWAFIKDYSAVITDLKNLALKERWHYKDINPKFPYPILANYLSYTFYRLAKEKIRFQFLKTGQPLIPDWLISVTNRYMLCL